jgi:hypothetical protein
MRFARLPTKTERHIYWKLVSKKKRTLKSQAARHGAQCGIGPREACPGFRFTASGLRLLSDVSVEAERESEADADCNAAPKMMGKPYRTLADAALALYLTE